MSCGMKSLRNAVIAAIAIMAVAFYALLLPGHLTSQFLVQVAHADAGMFADDICRGGDPIDEGHQPGSDCPLCKSLTA